MTSDADDRLEIRCVIARIAHASDSQTMLEYVGLFTDDVVCELPGAPPTTGVAAMATGIEARRASGVSGPGSDTRHVVSTIDVEIDGDVATSRAFWEFFTRTRSQPQVAAVGMYVDTLRRTEAGWKVTHRVVSQG
jgi:ketosteroid isomerase-like protein